MLKSELPKAAREGPNGKHFDRMDQTLPPTATSPPCSVNADTNSSGSAGCTSEIHTLKRHCNLPTLVISPLHKKEKIMSSLFNWQRPQNYFISLEHMKSCLYNSIQIPPPSKKKGTHSFWNVKDLATQLQEGLFPDLGLNSLYSVSASLAPRSQYFQYMFSQFDFTTK